MKKTAFILLFFLICSSSAQTEFKRIYTGLRLGGSIGMVFPVGDDYRDYYAADSVKWRDGGSFDIAPFFSYQITEKFALHTEVMATKFGYFGIIRENVISIREEDGVIYFDTLPKKEVVSRRAVIIPILVKYTLRQSNYSFQGFIGPHFTYNYGKWETRFYFEDDGKLVEDKEYNPDFINPYSLKYPPIGITLGLNFGIMTKKSGTIFADVRFLEDLGMVKVWGYKDGAMTWIPILLRGKLSFSLGWEFGFLNR